VPAGPGKVLDIVPLPGVALPAADLFPTLA